MNLKDFITPAFVSYSEHFLFTFLNYLTFPAVCR
jgi:hypothetical protein